MPRAVTRPCGGRHAGQWPVMRSYYRDGAALRGMIASVQALHSVRLPAPGRAGKNRLDVNTLGQGKTHPSPCCLPTSDATSYCATCCAHLRCSTIAFEGRLICTMNRRSSLRFQIWVRSSLMQPLQEPCTYKSSALVGAASGDAADRLVSLLRDCARRTCL